MPQKCRGSRCHSNAEFHHCHKLVKRFRICQRFLVDNRATVDNVANRQFDNPDFVLGISDTWTIFVGTWRGEAPVLIFALILA